MSFEDLKDLLAELEVMQPHLEKREGFSETQRAYIITDDAMLRIKRALRQLAQSQS